MPIQNLFILNQSRSQLTRRFFTLFECTHLPSHSQLFSFLEEYKLTCFITQKAQTKLTIKEDTADRIDRHIFFLPIDTHFSDDFTEKLCEYLKQTNAPIILYWTWQLLENKSYVALRITIQCLDASIALQTEILNPIGAQFTIAPVQRLRHQLQRNFEDYRIVLVGNSDVFAPVIGDTLYWTALSLLIKLAHDDSEVYRYRFKEWYQKNQSMLYYAKEHALNLAPYVHRHLFYIEQAVCILNIDFLRNLRCHYTPAWIKTVSSLSQGFITQFIPTPLKNISLKNALRVFILCGVLIDVFRQLKYAYSPKWLEDGLSLSQCIADEFIPTLLKNTLLNTALRIFAFCGGNEITLKHCSLVFLFSYLPTQIKKIAPAGHIALVIFYFGQLFSTACHLGINLYTQLPGDLTQRDIIAPRYIFEWMSIMSKGMITLLIQLISIRIFFELSFIIEKLIHRPIINTPNNQPGFHAIAFFMVQFFISSIEKELFQFERWVFPQYNEEAALFAVNNGACKKPCELKIKSSLSSRVMQQMFLNTERLNVELKNENRITECSLQLTHHRTLGCCDYQLDCQSRFFENPSNNMTTPFALANEAASQIHPTLTTRYCKLPPQI